jgi:hypothetical protein
MPSYLRLKRGLIHKKTSIRHIISGLQASDEFQKLPSVQVKIHNLESCIQDSVSNFDIRFIPKGETFHVVISRFSEDVSWIHKLSSFDCEVYLYNKGKPIDETFPPNVKIQDIDNIAYEDFVYLYHIVSYWNTFANHVIFMQCGLDHNVNILDDLKRVYEMRGYVNLTSSMGYSSLFNTFDSYDTYRLNEINDVTMENFEIETNIIRDHYCIDKNVNLYHKLCQLFKISPIQPIYFSLGANFHISKENILRNPLSFYVSLLTTIRLFDKSALKIVTKCHSCILERLWFTIFNQ